MVIFGVPAELAGADSHEGQAVTVGLVHVGLNLEYESGEVGAEGIHDALIGGSGQRGRGQLQECFQERLDAEVGQSGAEEDRGQLAPANGFHIHFTAGREQLHIIDELLSLGFAV